MGSRTRVTRREFLGAAGLLTAAASMTACRPREPRTITVVQQVTATTPPTTPTESAHPSTATAEPRGALLPEMALVAAGSFMMGSDEGLPKEAPVHEVMITRPYLVSIYPVTNAEYLRLCETTKKCNLPDDLLPVSGVNWFEAIEYCNWLSSAAGLTACYSGKGNFIKCDFDADGYRLPTEAEWEYAARGGDSSEGYLYSGGDDADAVAWYRANSGNQAHPVGEKLPNELGLFDMSGNVWEWCWDWYEETYYAESIGTDPTGPERAPSGPMPSKSRRSGSYNEESFAMRTTFRSADWISYQGGNGFRVVRTAL